MRITCRAWAQNAVVERGPSQCLGTAKHGVHEYCGQVDRVSVWWGSGVASMLKSGKGRSEHQQGAFIIRAEGCDLTAHNLAAGGYPTTLLCTPPPGLAGLYAPCLPEIKSA